MASRDTAIGEHLVVHVGDRVQPGPVRGTLTIPAAFVDQLRAAGLTSPAGEGGATVRFAENGVEWAPGFVMDAGPLPASGPATIAVSA